MRQAVVAIGATLTLLASILGLIKTRPVEGQFNVLVTEEADIEALTEEAGWELVRVIEPLHIVTVRGEVSPFWASLRSDVVQVTSDITVTVQEAPNDADWNVLWGMRRITHEGMSYDITRGLPDVVVAVVDTGVALDHPDLDAECRYSSVGGECRDGHGHGTHVAGIIAATMGNKIGVVGVTPEVRVWGYKVLADNGGGTVSSVTAGITKAADEITGAGYRGVINISLGADTGGNPEPVLDAAITYATEKGIVVVAAAGNSAQPYCMAPAISENAVCVSAIDKNGARAGFSNYGKGVAVAAPGVGIRSTLPGGRYANWDGTSMATPHVSGAMAAVLSIHPEWSVARIKRAVFAGAEKVSPDPDNFFGAGVVDVYMALKQAPEEPTPIPPRPTNTPMPYPPSPTPTTEPSPTPGRCSITVQRFVKTGTVERWWAYSTVAVLNWLGKDQEFEAIVMSIRSGYWDLVIQSQDSVWCSLWENVFDRLGYEVAP